MQTLLQIVQENVWFTDRFRQFSETPARLHCRLPQSQYADVNNYVKKFLLGDSAAPTDLQHTDGRFSTDTKAWIDWTTPRLR